MASQNHLYYMNLALELAAKGRGTTAPNPMVGCVIVHNDRVIGSGFHHQAGDNHAEINAILDAIQNGQQSKFSQSTCYVTLEPCCHTGKTGPCVTELIKHGFKTVVIAVQDPNPLVSGKGIKLLEQAGIKVVLGISEEQACLLNQGFITRIIKNRPFIRSKIAASLDGHIALSNGESKWITNELARADVHEWRAFSDAIVTTAATVNADNPSLTVRHGQQKLTKQPLRVVIDKDLTTDPAANIYQQNMAKTIVITSASQTNNPKVAEFSSQAVKVYYLQPVANQLPIHELWQLLAILGCNEVLIEAGGNFNGYLLSNNQDNALVDEWLVYQSGLIMGAGSKNMFNFKQLAPADSISNLFKLKCKHIKQLGDNWCIMFSQD